MSINDSLERMLHRAEVLMARIEAVLPQPLHAPDWQASIAFRYRKRSSGHGGLEPVRHVADMRLASLKEIDPQKEKIQRNTEQFVRGATANNVLLTGARGTGRTAKGGNGVFHFGQSHFTRGTGCFLAKNALLIAAPHGDGVNVVVHP